jgi:DNA mismatch repair ATPase MutS
MIFNSILFERAEDVLRKETIEAPDFFVDLNLDQIIDSATAGKQEYNLKPFFHTSLKDIPAIKYRQDVFRDLEDKNLMENIKTFAGSMRNTRVHLAAMEKLHYKYNKEGWFLEAVDIYCEAVKSLLDALTVANLKSCGLISFREYVNNYAGGDRFISLLDETKKIKADISSIKYCVLIRGNWVKVRKYESEIDYSADVEETFERFKQGAVKDYRVDLRAGTGMNHIYAKILDLVAKLHPAIFSELDNFCEANGNFVDETISVFDREFQFYISYLEHADKFKRAGLSFCYPDITDTDKEVHDYEGFDLALANRLIAENASTVCNDFYMKDKERIFVVSGPNQGGKTTFARVIGQLHYLASIGCPVPGTEARLFLFDRLFTHFEREENIKNLRGKLQDDLVRIHGILNEATPNSIIIMNEIFTSTTLKDAVVLGEKILERIIQLDLLCVCVTFIDEWASLGEKTVSMVSTIVPENPALRTYKIVRMPADGLAYAMSIAEKYGVTYHRLKERIKT